jgi:hypothetical protein
MEYANPGLDLRMVRFRSVDTSPASSSDLSGHLAVGTKRGTSSRSCSGLLHRLMAKKQRIQENCDTYKEQAKYGAHTPPLNTLGSHPWL